MSDLQASLIVIGVTIIGGVWLYNWVQERNFRKRLDRAFGAAPADALLPGIAPAGGAARRVEPHLDAPGAAAAGDQPGRDDGRPPGDSVQEPDPELDCVAGIESPAPLPQAALDELLDKLAGCGRPCRVLGANPAGAWEAVSRGAPVRYRRVSLALQLVNRSGSVNAHQLAIFCDAARGCAARTGGRAALPDADAALKAARELDAFCSRVDVAIGVNVVAPGLGAFSGERVRELAFAAGATLDADGVFRWRDGERRVLFSLDNRQPEPFIPERIAALVTPAVTFTLEVPLTPDAPSVFERMLGAARELAAALGGSLVDDNNHALTEAGIARIDGQLRAIDAELAARGIPAGGARAQRLFS
ncbi:MAG: hypothetical protein IT529_17845 [Burkholderiales bacterium]|nr:hypothetical protein [Burkholderiales bacterium]